MTRSGGRPGATCYRLRVDGHLGAHWSPWFAGLTLIHESDGTTTLTGDVADQAELHGLLARVRDLGVTLLSVQVHEFSTNGAQPTADHAPGPRSS
jgi:hypothetical protein